MDPAVFLNSVGQFGLGGIVFVVWYFDKKDRDGLQQVVQEQVKDKELMREERQKLLQVIESYATLTARLTGVLERVEGRLGHRVARAPEQA